MRMPLTAAVLVPLMLLALGCAPQASSTAPESPTTTQSLTDCPQGKTLRTFGVVGNAGFTATSRNYPGHRQTTIVSFAPPQL